MCQGRRPSLSAQIVKQVPIRLKDLKTALLAVLAQSLGMIKRINAINVRWGFIQNSQGIIKIASNVLTESAHQVKG
jgi:hypothetical protein